MDKLKIDFMKVSALFTTDEWDKHTKPLVRGIANWCAERGGFEAIIDPQHFSSLVFKLVMLARLSLDLSNSEDGFDIHELLKFMSDNSSYLNELADKAFMQASREDAEEFDKNGVKLVRVIKEGEE